MLSSLLRPSRRAKGQTHERSPFASSSPVATRRDRRNERSPLIRRNRHTATTYAETSGDEEHHSDSTHEDEEQPNDDEDGVRDETPLLPIFSAAHLGPKPSPEEQS